MHAERMRVYKDPLRETKQGETHGLSKDPIYKIWSGVKNRCNNKNNPSYKNYGARGIKLSEEFLDPRAFVNYVKSLPNFDKREKENLTLDRIDNNRNYERNNLRWATKRVQALNKGLSTRNTTGYNGVSFAPSYRGKKKFCAYTKEDGKHVHLGWFMTAEEANRAVVERKNGQTVLG